MIERLKYYQRVVGTGGMLKVVKSKITREPELLKIEREDCKSPIWLRFPASDIPTYEQVFMTYEYEFIMDKPPAVVIDAGANVGLASVLFANRYPEAKIIAIEPERENFEMLCRNVKDYPNVTPVHAALWNRNTEIELFNPGRGNWGFVTKENDAAEVAGDKVEALTVDEIMRRYGFDKVDILKMDIEGAEREVFSDTSAWIGKVDSLIIELHESVSPGCSRNFYTGTPGFETEWHQGENVYLSRGKRMLANNNNGEGWLK